MFSFHWSTMIFRFVTASKIVLLSFANQFGGNLPAPTSPSYLFDQVLLVYPSRTFSISHIFLAFAMDRLAGVRLGAGSGVRCPNLNLHLQVRFGHPANLNTNKRFRFERFGSGSHPVQ